MEPNDNPHGVAATVVGPEPCVYFPERTMHAIVIGADEDAKPGVYSQLAKAGFRRSGGTFYTPRCGECRACVPLRVDAKGFRVNRRFRRVLARNADLTVTLAHVEDAAMEHFDLYGRYISARHAHGSMFPPHPKQYLQLTQSFGVDTLALDIRQGDTLVASAVTDVLDHGLAAVYTYFDPDLPERSLGALAILKQIDECRRRSLPHLYLGYWIAEAQKMRYKADYRPAQVLVDGRWSALGDNGP